MSLHRVGWWTLAVLAAVVALRPGLPASAWPLPCIVFAFLPGHWFASRLWPQWPREQRLGVLGSREGSCLGDGLLERLTFFQIDAQQTDCVRQRVADLNAE